MKTVFMFSGQGAQYIGMGKELYSKYSESKEIFHRADNVLGFKISDICFNENDELNITEFTQPAILTTSIAILEVLKSRGISADYVCGLSLGEYSALVASGAISFEDAVCTVRSRGKFMSEAVPAGKGGMMAVLNADKDLVIKCCKEASVIGVCEPANFNCPGQIVIGGDKEAVIKAGEILKENGVKKTILLNVSGPFHTSLLIPAADKLSEVLNKINFNEPAVPVIANCSADYVKSKDEIKELLIKQVSNPVLWEDSIRKLIEDGADTFVEIGPGKSLSSFMKKINKEVRVYNVEDEKTLEKLLEEWEN